MWWSDKKVEEIVGASVEAVFWSETELILVTDRGGYAFAVDGDCCSWSYFFDFYGIEKLLTNGPVTAFEEVDLGPGDPGYHDPSCTYRHGEPSPCGRDHDEISVYGFRFTTQHPLWGEQSSVLSFRNDSNGYYGGWMSLVASELPVAYLDGELVGVQGYDLSKFERLLEDKIG